MTKIIALIIVGLVFVGFEVIVPGGILGVFGALCMLGACLLAYEPYGVVGVMWVAVISFALIFLVLFVELKIIAKTKLGSKFFLKKANTEHSTHPQVKNLEGKEGEVVTQLSPTGTVLVEGNQYEAFSQDGVLKTGDNIKVIGKDNFRLIVRKISH